jgi:hypothetical protein
MSDYLICGQCGHEISLPRFQHNIDMENKEQDINPTLFSLGSEISSNETGKIIFNTFRKYY